MEQRLGQVIDGLAYAGVTLVPLTLGVDLSTIGSVGLTIAMAENLPALRAYFTEHGLPFDPALLATAIASPDVRNVIRHLTSGNGPNSAAYAAALAEIRERLHPAWTNAFTNHSIDALLMPTTPLPAARIGEDEFVAMDGRLWPTFDTYVRNCGPATLLGLPSVTLPAGFTHDQGSSLPVGLMLDGPSNTDRRLLAIAAALNPFLPSTPELL
jgi:mandelamide amidase